MKHIFLVILFAVGTVAFAEGTSAVARKFGISEANQFESTGLRGLEKSVQDLTDFDEDAFVIFSHMKMANAKNFDVFYVGSILSGRLNEKYELNLNVSDEEAALGGPAKNSAGMILSLSEKLYCQHKDSADQAFHYMLPYTSRKMAKEAGLNWSKESIAAVKSELANLAPNCDFAISRVGLGDGSDQNATLLAVWDRKTNEILVIGFGSNP